MIKNLPIICLTFFKFYVGAQNFVATYGFADVTSSTGTVDPSSTPNVTGLSCKSFSAIGASINPSASGRFSFTNWPTGALNGTDDYSNYTGVLSPTVYYEVSIAVNPSYSLTLNTITFSMRRSGTGIRQYCVRSNLDGYTNNLAASTGTATKLSVIPNDVFFWNYDSVSTSSEQKGSSLNLGNAFSNLTQPVTFRFFAWNAESSGGTFSIDNVSFIGSILDSLTASNPLSIDSYSTNLFKVYPNPCSDKKLILEGILDFERIEILSTSGKLVKTYVFPKNENKAEVDLSSIDSGLYFLRTVINDSVTLHKIILTP
jgi:hypothetical protein